MRYFFVKIGSGNQHAYPLLAEKELESPVVAGFFRKITINDIVEHLDSESVRFSRQAIDLYK